MSVHGSRAPADGQARRPLAAPMRVWTLSESTECIAVLSTGNLALRIRPTSGDPGNSVCYSSLLRSSLADYRPLCGHVGGYMN